MDINILEQIYRFLLSTTDYNRFHVWSLIVYALFCFFVFIKLIKYLHPIYAFMLAYVLGMLGNNTYESLWQYIMYENGINSYFMQYIIVDIGLIVLVIACNYKFKFLSINKWMIILLIIELSSFGVLELTGHYAALRIWLANGYQGADPHNWIWMINKALGVWFLYPMVLNKEQHKERIK